MYEEGTLRQKSYGENKVTIKSEPICTVTGKKKDCLRCGKENFSMEHLKVCPAKGKQCNKCGVTGHFTTKQNAETTEKKNNLRLIQAAAYPDKANAPKGSRTGSAKMFW